MADQYPPLPTPAQIGAMSSTNDLGEVPAAGGSHPATSRSNLGVGIGTNVQAWSAFLDLWSALNPASFLTGSTTLAGAITGTSSSTATVEAQTVAAGTAYTLTGSSAAVVFGTTSPTITLPSTGTWKFFVTIQTTYAGATVTLQNVNVKIRKTNGTPADLTASSWSQPIPSATLLSADGPQVNIGPCAYTGTSGDTITIFANLSGLPSLGNITITKAVISASKTS